MSSRRSRQSSSSSSRITDDEIIQLISKLQQLLPGARIQRSNKPGVSLEAASLFVRSRGKTVYILPSSDPTLAMLMSSASKVLQETCTYVRSLHREVDDLSDRLSQLLSTIDADSPEASIVRSLIM